MYTLNELEKLFETKLYQDGNLLTGLVNLDVYNKTLLQTFPMVLWPQFEISSYTPETTLIIHNIPSQNESSLNIVTYFNPLEGKLVPVAPALIYQYMHLIRSYSRHLYKEIIVKLNISSENCHLVILNWIDSESILNIIPELYIPVIQCVQHDNHIELITPVQIIPVLCQLIGTPNLFPLYLPRGIVQKIKLDLYLLQEYGLLSIPEFNTPFMLSSDLAFYHKSNSSPLLASFLSCYQPVANSDYIVIPISSTYIHLWNLNS